MQMNLLTSVRPSDAVFGDVDEAEWIEGHVLDSPAGDVFLLILLRSVSETQLARFA
jgi:hypothetical protein